MANNQPCIPYAGANAEGFAERISDIIAKALDYPKRCASSVGLTVQNSWNGIGNTPVGWTKRPTTTWFSTATLCAVRVPVAMQTLLAAAPAQNRLRPDDKATLNAALATITTIDLDLYGAICPGDKQRPIANLPAFMTAWDAEVSNHSSFQTDYGGTTNAPWNVYNDTPHRQAYYGWDLYNYPGDAAVDTQTIHDQRLLELSGTGAPEAIGYVWYPDPDDFNGDPSNRPLQAYIQMTAKAHRLSPNKNLVKYYWIIDPNWWSHNAMPPSLPGDWGRASTYASRIASAANESCYFRFNNRPVIGIYNYASLSAGNKTTFLGLVDNLNAAVLAATGQSPLWVVNDNNTTTGTDMIPKGCRWKTTYGPNPTLTGSNVQNPYSQQNIWDRATWDTPGGGIQLASTVVILQDRRPKGGAATPYVDPPRVRELMEAINAAQGAYKSSARSELLCLTGALGEMTESGQIERTAQNGTKYFDAIRFARGGAVPATYVEKVDASYLSHVTTAGTWAETRQLGATFHDSNEMRSTGGTGSRREYSDYRVTKLEYAASKGPAFGIANIYLDGVLQTTVDLYSAAPVAPAVLWSSGTLSQGLHTLAAEESGTRNASSSANTISWDYTQQTIVP